MPNANQGEAAPEVVLQDAISTDSVGIPGPWAAFVGTLIWGGGDIPLGLAP